MNPKIHTPSPLENLEGLHLPKSELKPNAEPQERTERKAGGRENRKQVKPGDRFERLLILGKTQARGKERIAYQCSCGSIGLTDERSILRGLTKSCGCYHRDVLLALRRESKLKDRGRNRKDWGSLVGQTIKDLKVIEHFPATKGKPDYLLIECDRGHTHRRNVYCLDQLACAVCSRTARKEATERSLPTWWKRIFDHIIQRCYNKNDGAWPRYGGIGIGVWDGWRRNPRSFYQHVGDRPSKDHTIDRIDNSRGYEPGNVKWATRTEQQNNRRNNVVLEFNGQKKTLTQWAREYGINHGSLARRIEYGWSMSEALLTPIQKRRSSSTAQSTTRPAPCSSSGPSGHAP
jgi:hypothetical protein